MNFDLGYAEWKGWNRSSFGTCEPTDSYYLEREVFSRIPPGGTLIDVGFGNGTLLAAAAKRGFYPIGVEANPELVAIAQSFGFQAISCITDLPKDFADVVTLFDVLEHIHSDQQLQFIRTIRSHLKPDGLLIIRVPNGDSPFSLRSQNGDPTHVSWIGSIRLGWLARQAGYAVVSLGNPASALRGAGIARAGGRIIKFLMRRVIETIIGLAYFGRVFPLDDMLVAVLKKSDSSANPRTENGR